MRHAAGGGGSHRDAYFLTLSTLFTASLNAFPAVNFTVFSAVILITSPVLGLRPVRAAREPVLKLPNPTSCTALPLTSDFVMIPSNASSCSLVITFVCPVLPAIASTSSCLFMFLALERKNCYPVVFLAAKWCYTPYFRPGAGGRYKDVPHPIETAHHYTVWRQQAEDV